MRLAALLAVAAAIVVAAAPGAKAAGFDEARFANPPSDSRPTLLWFWNGTVTPDLIDRQLADMRAQGVDEVLVFPFDTANLRPAFFSEGWFDLIEHTLREAQANGMHVWLFNDDFFPSGRGAGKVVEEHPDERPDGITRRTRTLEGGKPVPLDDANADAGLQVQDGRLIVDAGGRQGVTLLEDGADWQDYDVSATVSPERGTAGLMVRSPDEKNGYLVDLRDDGGVNVWRQDDGNFSLLQLGEAKAGFDPAADHELTASLRGDQIVPSLDGAQLPAVTDGRYPTGRVGVRAVASQRSSWDRLAVTGADGTKLYDEDFSSSSALDAFDIPPGANTLVAVAARPEGSTDAKQIVDLTADAKAGRDWDAPAGRWRIDTFTSHELADADPNSFRRDYLDLLDDDAVGHFLDAVPGEYYKRFPWAFGTVLRGFADDEPFIASADAHFQAVPWTPKMASSLQAHGANPAAALSAVHDDLGRGGRDLRGAFWRTVSDRFASAYYKQQYAWMQDHGVRYISNPLWDEYGPAEQVKSTGNLLTVNQWAQVPGTDLVFDHFQRGYQRTLPRWAASSAHQLGMERVYLEGMGAMGWNVTPSLAHQVYGSFGVRGINFALLHATFTDPGFVPYPPPFQPLNPWWDKSRPLNEFIGRLMEAGRSKAPAVTALIQPQRAAEAWQDTSRADQIDASFTDSVHSLEDHQVDFDLVDDGALDGDPALRLQADAQGGQLRVGEQAYEVAVLPETPTMSVGAVRTLAQFVRGGGTLIAAGALPTEAPGGDDAALASALGDLFSHPGAGRAIRVDGPAGTGGAAADAGGAASTLSPAVPEVRVLRLARDDERAFMVVNERGQDVSTTATFPATGAPRVWHPESGRTGAAGVWRVAGAHRDATAVPLRLAPYETAVVVFPKTSGAGPHAVSSELPVESVEAADSALRATVRADRPGRFTVVGARGDALYSGIAEVTDPLQPVALGGDWSFRFERDGAQATQRPLGSWTAVDPAFSGSAVYEKHVTLDAAQLAGRRFTLDLGQVRDVAEIEVNGTAIGSRLWAPYRADVTDALKPGDNLIHVRVTNTGANARGDAQPSGLLGPVALRPTRSAGVTLANVRGARVLELGADPVRVAPGQARTAKVTVRDLSGRSGDVTLDAAGDGVTVSPASVTVKLGQDGSGQADVKVTAPEDAALPSRAALTLSSGDVESRVPVEIEAATRLGTATASSSYPGHGPETAIDGITDSAGWDQGQGWNDGTPDAYPDTLSVAFDGAAPIGRVRVHTLDSAQYPAATFGIRDADVQLHAGGEWRTVGQIRGNAQGVADVTFPAVQADAVRLVVSAARVSYSRVIELEAVPR